jgi:hypothetical protein
MGISILSCPLVVIPNCNNVPDVLVLSIEVVRVSLCSVSRNNQIAIKIVTLSTVEPPRPTRSTTRHSFYTIQQLVNYGTVLQVLLRAV